MHDQRRLVMAHSTPRAPNFSLLLLFSLGHAMPRHAKPCHGMACQIEPSELLPPQRTRRFLSRLLRASDFDRRESPEGEARLTSIYLPTYPPTHLATYLPTCNNNAEPFCETRVNKPHRITPLPRQVFLLRAGLVSQVSSYFCHVTPG